MLPQLSLLYLKPRHEVTVEVLRKYGLTVEISSRQIAEVPPEMAAYVTSIHMPYSTHELGRLNYAAVDDDFRELSLEIIEEAMRQAGRLYPEAGLAVMRAINVGQSHRPVLTRALTYSPSAHSSEMMPNGARENSNSFSSAAWGAWSVARQSIVPSATPARRASTSSAVRSGGFIL